MCNSFKAHSFKTKGKMPSGPYALFLSKGIIALWIAHNKIIRRGIGLVGGASGGTEMLQPFKLESQEKQEPKRLAISVETAVVSLQQRSKGKEEQQKLLEILLAKEQKDISGKIGEVVTFPLNKCVSLHK